MSQLATEGLAVAEEKWLTVAEAATQVSVPLRTLHRWVKSGAVRCRADGKKRQVLLPEVQKHASERGPGATGAPTIAGTVPARAPLAQNMALLSDGDLAARVFGLLDDGHGPAEIVRQERLAPAIVLGLSEQWTRLRAAGKPGDVPVRDQVVGLRRKLDTMDELLNKLIDLDLGIAFGDVHQEATRLRAEFAGAVDGVAQRLGILEQRIASNERAWAQLFAMRGA